MTPKCEVLDAKTRNRLANILAIGTANPPNVMYQSDFPDFYFRLTNCEHMIDLKTKFKRICEKTTIKKRYTYMIEDTLKENPNMCDYNASSLDTRQALLADEVPKLGQEAAMKAIEEWGQPKSKITHLIFCTTSVFDMPGPDYHLARLLNLDPSVKRYMFCQQGCHAGATVLRVAKDLAENNHGARILVICSEIMDVVGFHGPSETNLSSMLAQALFGDGAGSVIVGTLPDESFGERSLFELVSTSQTILPNSETAIEGHLRETGLATQILPSVPELVSNNVRKSLVEAFDPIKIHGDWNSIFWIAHPGGPAILGQIEAKLGLIKRKLSTSWHVLAEFGNMSSASVFFIMDETRKKSMKERKATTGDGLDYGVLFGFGPGLTIETIVLRSFPTN